jgi:lipopolysaccharide heptosyltransferase II
MRIVDEHVGMWLSRAIALVLRLCGMQARRSDHPTPPAPGTVSEILILKFLGMGSILQATSLLQALRGHYPGARITLLSFRENLPLADFDLGVDVFEFVDASSVWRFFSSHIRTIRRLRRTRFDLLLNLEFFTNYGTLMTFALRKRFAMAFGNSAQYRAAFFHDMVSYDNAWHIREKYFSFARRLGYTAALPPLARLHVDDAPTVAARLAEQLRFTLDPAARHIIVNVNAGELAVQRRWPAEHYRTVVEGLLDQPLVRCLLIGGPNDREWVDTFQASLSRPERVINLAGRTSLRQLVALMELSTVYVGNDSGALHIATCVNLPVVAFFGPESPLVYGPPASPHNRVFYRAEPCSPCLNAYTSKRSTCRDNVCLKRILPQQVLDVLDNQYLNEAAASVSGHARNGRIDGRSSR